MQELRFKVKGPKSSPYEVVIRKKGRNLTALCSCSSGANDLCQHRINIMTGLSTDIVSKNVAEVNTVASWLAGTDVNKALLDFVDAIKRLEIAQEDYNLTKKQLIKSMLD